MCLKASKAMYYGVSHPAKYQCCNPQGLGLGLEVTRERLMPALALAVESLSVALTLALDGLGLGSQVLCDLTIGC